MLCSEYKIMSRFLKLIFENLINLLMRLLFSSLGTFIGKTKKFFKQRDGQQLSQVNNT